MKRTVDVHFVMSGGAREGLGHVLRSIALVQEAQQAGLRVAGSLAGDEWARSVAKRELPSLQLTSWQPDGMLDPAARWFVFDTRRPIGSSLRRVRNAGGKTLVLDRLDHADDADLSIVPAAHGAFPAHQRVRHGPEYCVIAPSLRCRPPEPYPGERDRLVVSLGGADPLNSSAKLVDDLARCLAHRPAGRPEVHFILGPAFGERPELEASLAEQDWAIHRAPSREELGALLRRALLAVLGFGSAIYEAAYLGVPVVYVTHDAGDVAHAQRLEALGLGRFGTCGTRYDGYRLRGVLTAAIADEIWRSESSRRGRALLGDGRGAQRILAETGLLGESVRDAGEATEPSDALAGRT